MGFGVQDMKDMLSRSDSGIVGVGERPRFPCVRPYLWNVPEETTQIDWGPF